MSTTVTNASSDTLEGVETLKIQNEGDDDVVDPWNVVSKSETGVDYDKLISKIYVCLYSINL